MKKNGFTLTELIAVIAIVGLLIVIATTAVAPWMISSKEQTAEMTLKNLEDAAVTYALDKLFIPDDCAIDYIVDKDHPKFNKPSKCTLAASTFEIQVKSLIDNGYFKDDAKKVDRGDKVIIYKYKTKKPKSALDCYSGSNFIDKKECYNYDTKAYAKESLVIN